MQQLSIAQLEAVNAGAGDVKDIIDGACAIAGVAALVTGGVAAPALAFCAGWGLGAWLFS
jgi:hypothetical protein